MRVWTTVCKAKDAKNSDCSDDAYQSPLMFLRFSEAFHRKGLKGMT